MTLEQEPEITGPVPIVTSKISSTTKVLTWLTAALLSASVLVALVALTLERNDLRAQIREQSVELECRADATSDLFSALTDHFIIIGMQNSTLGQIAVAIGEGAPFEPLVQQLDDINEELNDSNALLLAAIDTQRRAIATCGN